MRYLFNNQQKLNDIIFANRNQAYGAYAIRSDYGVTILKSVSFMVIGVGSALSLALFLNNSNNEDPELCTGQLIIPDTIYTVPVNLKKEEPAARQEEHSASSKPDETKPDENRNVTVVDSTLLAAAIPTTEATVSNATTLSSTDPGSALTGNGAGTSTTIGSALGTDSSAVQELFRVDSAPEFEGGLNALYRFVSQQLRYPDWASREGREGTVFVKFVVDENGKVGSLRLLNSAGYGMDDEALRVVSLIPKFKSPAKLAGVPVKTYYQLPIRFRFKY